MLKIIRKLVLRSKRIQRVLLAHRVQQKKQRHHENWELIMRGLTVRDENTEKPHKTLAVVDDEGVNIEYMDGRFVNQRYVTPMFIDSTNWGG